MTKGKTYRYDDEFKAKARAHQFAFRVHIPEHTRSLSGSLLGYKTIP